MNGQPIYKSPLDIPKTLEAAVIIVSAKFAVKAAEDCMKKGAKYLIVIPGGFNEMKTEEGRQRQAQLVSLGKQYQCRIIGPNCMGVYDPSSIDTLFVGEEGYIWRFLSHLVSPSLALGQSAFFRKAEPLPLPSSTR